MDSLNTVKHSVDRTFVADHLGEGYLRQSILDDLVKANDDGPDAAIAFVHAAVEHARVAVAVLGHDVFIKDLYYLIKLDILSRAGE